MWLKREDCERGTGVGDDSSSKGGGIKVGGDSGLFDYCEGLYLVLILLLLMLCDIL